ncbi:hypothetical protein ACHAWF_008154 [Thalassiosira exigua]
MRRRNLLLPTADRSGGPGTGDRAERDDRGGKSFKSIWSQSKGARLLPFLVAAFVWLSLRSASSPGPGLGAEDSARRLNAGEANEKDLRVPPAGDDLRSESRGLPPSPPVAPSGRNDDGEAKPGPRIAEPPAAQGRELGPIDAPKDRGAPPARAASADSDGGDGAEDGSNDRFPAPRNCGVVFFYHVNNVGGRTVQEHLKESTREYLQIFANGPNWAEAVPEVEAFLQFGEGDEGKEGRWKALEVHHGFPGLLLIRKELAAWERKTRRQGCSFRKVTLLRNPVERLVSNMRWNDVELDVQEYAANTANWMSRHLAYNVCDEGRDCEFKRSVGRSNAPQMTDGAFRSLLDVLDGFDAVGVTEDLQGFVDDVLGRPAELAVTYKQDYEEDDFDFPLAAEDYEEILALNLYDLRLYWRYAPAVLPVSVERAEDMTFQKMQRYYLLNKPLIVRGAGPLLFRNHADFNVEYVRENVDPEMEIDASVNSGRLLNGDVTTTVPECLDMPGRCVYFKKSEFSYEDDDDEGPIETDDEDAVRTTLLAGMNRTTFAWEGPNEGIYNIYVSTRGGALPHNHPQRFNVLMEGRKRWILVDPTAYADQAQVDDFELWEETGLHHIHDDEGGDDAGLTWTGTNYKPQDWFRDVIDKGVDVPHYDFVQEAGDLFFLPHKFTHGTMDLTRHTVGVIFRDGILDVGTDGLRFGDESARSEDLPRRPARAPGGSKLAERGHKLPAPREGRGSTDEEAWGWEWVAGDAARRFKNEQLEYSIAAE